MEKSTFSPLNAVFRERLRAFRREAGLTQRELAERLEREPSFIARLELGERRLDVIEFYWLCTACGLDPVRAAADVMREFAGLERGRRKT
jgi:transcriptional regulator with XRE-family HTH domain